MERITLNVFNIAGSPFCVEAEDGERVYNLIIKAFKVKKGVELSFKNVDILTTAFLNTAVGQLYRDFTEDFIRQNLGVQEMSPSGLVSLKRVVDTAKIFYKDPDALKRSIEEILGE